MKVSINDCEFDLQAREAVKMERISFERCLENICHDWGSYDDGEFCVDTRILDLETKRLILSYLELDKYENKMMMHSEIGTDIVFEDRLKYIKDKLGNASQKVYRESMEEMGCVMGTYSDNGESYWYKPYRGF